MIPQVLSHGGETVCKIILGNEMIEVRKDCSYMDESQKLADNQPHLCDHLQAQSPTGQYDRQYTI
jgi:hypothetical protein